MGADITSPSLLSRVRDPADAAAWREFDATYGEFVLRYCRRCGLQHSDAEDVRQMVMVRLSKALRQFQYDPRRGRFRSFLWRVVRNEINRYLGRPDSATRGVDTDGAPLADTAGPERPDEPWEEEWTHHHLRLAMRRIRATHDPRSIAVFERLLAGDTVYQVAAAFTMSTDAVHKVRQRVRARLKELVAEQIRDEDEPDARIQPN
jgi:RNA polymerase sigma-70 factor (ECF subfamily)